MSDRRLDDLAKRIDAARAVQRLPEPKAPIERKPLSTVFDKWNEEIRQRDIESGRLSINQQALMLLIFVVLAIVMTVFFGPD